jgi:hypothetical protein
MKRLTMYCLLAAGSVAAGTMYATPAASAAPKASPALEAPTHVAVASLTPSAPGQVRSFAEVSAARQVDAPLDVASGYTLIHPGRTSSQLHVYDSDSVYFDDYRCTTTCVDEAELKVQEHQYIVGGSSKQWALQENAATMFNPGGETWTYTAIYYCAVNVGGSPDHYCGNGADASGTSAPMTPGENVYKTFEKVNGNIVYPMVGISAHFNTGDSVIAKFRGWDTCNKATTTMLCAGSGNGS